jgi:hypothetical protein
MSTFLPVTASPSSRPAKREAAAARRVADELRRRRERQLQYARRRGSEIEAADGLADDDETEDERIERERHGEAWKDIYSRCSKAMEILCSLDREMSPNLRWPLEKLSVDHWNLYEVAHGEQRLLAFISELVLQFARTRMPGGGNAPNKRGLSEKELDRLNRARSVWHDGAPAATATVSSFRRVLRIVHVCLHLDEFDNGRAAPSWFENMCIDLASSFGYSFSALDPAWVERLVEPPADRSLTRVASSLVWEARRIAKQAGCDGNRFAFRFPVDSYKTKKALTKRFNSVANQDETKRMIMQCLPGGYLDHLGD